MDRINRCNILYRFFASNAPFWLHRYNTCSFFSSNSHRQYGHVPRTSSKYSCNTATSMASFLTILYRLCNIARRSDCAAANSVLSLSSSSSSSSSFVLLPPKTVVSWLPCRIRESSTLGLSIGPLIYNFFLYTSYGTSASLHPTRSFLLSKYPSNILRLQR